MRQWIRPRSLLLHLAYLAIAGGCFTAAWWQVHRAMAGNTLSYLYSVEWPFFAVVAGIGWWQMVHDTPADIEERKAHHARMRAASAAVVARTLPRSALAITVGAEDVGRRALGDGGGEAPALTVSTGDDGRLARVPAVRSSTALEGMHPGETGAEEAEDEMTRYNRYLAVLAVRGRAKTWRNPRGLG